MCISHLRLAFRKGRLYSFYPSDTAAPTLLPTIEQVNMAYFAPGLRRFAARLATPTSICRQCQRQQPQFRPASRIASVVRSQARVEPTRLSSTLSGVGNNAAPAIGDTAQKKAEEAARATGKARPEKTTSKAVMYWLFGSAASVFGIVVWGGLTRLTESGYVF